MAAWWGVACGPHAAKWRRFLTVLPSWQYITLWQTCSFCDLTFWFSAL